MNSSPTKSAALVIALAVTVVASLQGQAQDTDAKKLAAQNKELRAKVQELRSRLEETKDEVRGLKAQLVKLRQELAQVKTTAVSRLTFPWTEEDRILEELYGKLGRAYPPPEAVGWYFDLLRTARELKRMNSGRILARVEGTKKVYINQGSRNGLELGARFEVLEVAQSGKNEPPLVHRKGMIRVEEVKPEYALATITSEIRQSDPIDAGDQIRNPFLCIDAEEKMRFALVGEEFGSWNRTQLTRLIENAGGRVEAQVHIYTDYVVVGSPGMDGTWSEADAKSRERAERFVTEEMPLRRLARYLAEDNPKSEK